MDTSHCLNCNKTLEEQVKFCPECGQSRNVHRFTMANFIHEGFHAFTHTDRGIFHLLKELALRPGTTARSFIRGKRKSYFNPFTFFLILMGVFVLSNSYFKKERRVAEPSARVLQNIPTEEGKKKYLITMDRVNKSAGFFNKHGNVVAMIAVPFISMFTFLFFRRKGFNYAEHLTANMMFVAFSNLIFTLIIFPLSGLVEPDKRYVFTALAMLLQVLYFGWALNGFLDLKKAGARTKSFLVSLLAIILWAIFSVSMMAVYIYQSGDFYQFFTKGRS